ncbi:DUF3784 domain-containing protein [Ornithinibacillus xuwenensis]|uniref:DUF3784 domain-containing protein n=1 Tax=Ornithinibacillus xuwenensis TaxID=3144668 RepID=A0ABU9XH38_9BACI
MSNSMLIFIVVMGWTLIVFGGITYLIVKKKEYSLISGFYNRPKEEQEYLIQYGYIEKMGKVLLISFYLLIIATLLTVFGVPYGIEIGFGLFMLELLGGIIYIQKYEVPHKRKKYYLLYGIITFVTIGIVGGLFVMGNMKSEFVIKNDTFIISGMYGVEWSVEEIEKVELLDQLPEIMFKNSGLSSTTTKKGKFTLEAPYGKGRLFVQVKNSPFIYVSTKEDYVIINRDSPKETKAVYQQLLKLISLQ